ncbi:MAG TPA: LysE family translocator [Acidothermaceae bacterium]|jgi:threonine/homoserine/homoserine lactone efflux protein|nr:LysE family translocator [Acidothermaceae bacterium]
MLAAVLAFAAAAALLTLTPGLDTMFVVRTAIASGPRIGMIGGLGVSLGTLTWGCASAVGITAVLVASHIAYDALRIAGAAYLTLVGVRMLWHSRKNKNSPDVDTSGRGWAPGRATSGFEAFRTGLLTNLLNPKVGVFYVTLLPQFVPRHAPVLAFSVLLASIHVVEGIVWFGVLTAATMRVRRLVTRPKIKRTLDRITGCVFIGFGARLALEGGRVAAR